MSKPTRRALEVTPEYLNDVVRALEQRLSRLEQRLEERGALEREAAELPLEDNE